MNRSRGTHGAFALALVCGLLMSIPAGATRPVRYEIPAPSLHEKARDVNVWLPPSYDTPAGRERRYPVIYLLHGFPGSAGDWFGRAHAGDTADSLIAQGRAPEVILVSPDGNRGFFGRTLYANAWDGSFDMEDFIRRDLVAWTDSVFRTRRDPRARGVIGLSDGGTAAFNLALRHPTEFGAAGSHSADFRIEREFGMGKVVGPADQAGPRLRALGPLDYLREGEAPTLDPVLYFDCGRDDDSFPENRELDHVLDSIRVAHEFREFPGSHTWSYWREHFRQSLEAVTARMRDAEGGGPAEPRNAPATGTVQGAREPARGNRRPGRKLVSVATRRGGTP